MQSFIYVVETDKGIRYVLSLLPTEKAFKKGLFGYSIVGYILDPQKPITQDNFKVNPAFLKLFHSIIQTITVQQPDFQGRVKEQGEGVMYVVDLRDRHYPNTRTSDIIGGFPIIDKQAQSSNYEANPNYLLVNEDGLFRLPKYYIDALMEAIESD
jgi:hypothetical protein